jgi:hypothetical protein
MLAADWPPDSLSYVNISAQNPYVAATLNRVLVLKDTKTRVLYAPAGSDTE